MESVVAHFRETVLGRPPAKTLVAWIFQWLLPLTVLRWIRRELPSNAGKPLTGMNQRLAMDRGVQTGSTRGISYLL